MEEERTSGSFGTGYKFQTAAVSRVLSLYNSIFVTLAVSYLLSSTKGGGKIPPGCLLVEPVT